MSKMPSLDIASWLFNASPLFEHTIIISWREYRFQSRLFFSHLDFLPFYIVDLRFEFLLRAQWALPTFTFKSYDGIIDVTLCIKINFDILLFFVEILCPDKLSKEMKTFRLLSPNNRSRDFISWIIVVFIV